jgi:hypothetical protein
MTDRRDFRRRERKKLRVCHPERESLITDDDSEIELHQHFRRQAPVYFLEPIGLGHQRRNRGTLPLEPSRIAYEPHQAKPPGLSGATGLFGKVNAPAAVVAGRSEFTLYRIGPDGALAGDIDLNKIAEPAARARLRQIGRDPTDYMLSIDESKLGNDGTLRFSVIMFVVKKQTEADYRVEMKVTPGKAPLHARIVSFRKSHVVE